jgi:aminoglycoside phosphotransferase (APT) family kinase protein
MRHDIYLTSVIDALRNDILPALPTPELRDQLLNCLRVLCRLKLVEEDSLERTRDLTTDARIPMALRQAFSPAATDLRSTPMAEEITVNTRTLSGMRAASDWLERGEWYTDDQQRQVARALLGYERQWRAESLARMKAAQRSDEGAATETLSGPFLNQDSLQAYLRDKLKCPALKVIEYKRLSGGRTRKTVVFKQEGYPDWPAWLVIQCDPKKGYVQFPGVLSQFPVIAHAYRSGKINVPRPLLMEAGGEPFGTAFMIVEKLPGRPMVTGMDFFAKPPPSKKLALDMARQLGALHSLGTEPVENVLPIALADETGWAGDLEKLIASMKGSAHGPSMTLSAAFAWMRQNVDCVSDAKSIVHGDFNQHNLLIEDERVTGVLDWEGVRISHPGHDIGYVRPLIEQMAPFDEFMAVYRDSGGHPLSPREIDFFSLRAYIVVLQSIAHAHGMFIEGMTSDVRVAEVGCSLGAEFLRCIGDMLERILRTA